MRYENSLAWAKTQDVQDSLAKFRDAFHFPQHEGENCVYFCGNSLGLQPKKASEFLNVELEEWKTYGVEGHFKGRSKWMYYHKFLTDSVAQVVGAKPEEVVVMNNLTVNLHLMMVSFYRPTNTRFKILMEGGAFPSDQYAMESQVKFHGFSPEEAIVELVPREGEHTLRKEDILEKIEELGDTLALVMLGGVNYYTGQFYPLEAITKAGHAVGATVGFDLAHAAGNVPLKLHDWGADFAVWCSYKYLNSGPGGTSGVFVHERHADNPDLPRFAGWWGHDEESRFLMKKGFIPMHGAEGWQLSNAQIFPMALHRAALSVLEEAGGMEALREKSLKLTGFLEFLIDEHNAQDHSPKIEVLTPRNPEERGCQLSLVVPEEGKAAFDRLTEAGVIADWREPDVIRIAPVPLYNSFEDCFRFMEIIKR